MRNSTLSVISLRLPFISLESLTWVIDSLQQDEMAPNDRAIQQRSKEAYGFKISKYFWEKGILDFIKRDVLST